MAINNIRTTGLDRVIRKLRSLEESVSPPALEQNLERSVALLLSRIRERFLAEKDPNNKPWKPSAAAMAEGRKTLFKTGRLFRSIQAFNLGPLAKAVGTDVPYAKFHQFGTRRLPARPFIGANQQDTQDIVQIFVQRIKRAVTNG